MAQRVEAFGKILEFPDDLGHEEIAKVIRNNEHVLNPDWKQPGGLSGLAKNVLTGAKQTGRMVGATVDAASNNLAGVENYAKESQVSAQQNMPVEQRKLIGELSEINRDHGALSQIGDTLKAAGRNPMGTGQLVAEQLPNTAVSLGGGYAGFKTGAAAGALFGPVGATIGGAIGFVGGMFLGNVLLEAGGKAIEKASDADGFTPQDRDESLREGAVKGAVITGIDAATFKVGGLIAKKLGSAAINAGAKAEAKVLIDAGVDTTSLTAINAALKSSPELFKSARIAGEKAALQSLSTGRKAGIIGTGMALETASEGIGEYAGEYAATGKGDVVDATIEALSSATMSIAETAYNYNKVAAGNDLSPEGIQKVAGQVNEFETKSGIDEISKAATVDDAIKVANKVVSRKPETKDSILTSIDPTLADIERLTGLKPSKSIETALNEGQQGLNADSISSQTDTKNILSTVNVEGQITQPSEGMINEEKIAQKTTTPTKSTGVLGKGSEVVLPDGTSLSAQWQLVDADSISASIKEGVNQPRDRTRAASDIQIQGIANNPDYRRLSDSPVMDVGAPTIDSSGAIVAGNGRFEALSRAHEQGTSKEYLDLLRADAVNKGIDPAMIDAMKKPVLVRRITQPFDTRKLAIASNSGTSLQYSGLELAKIDAGRMAGIEDLDITDSGDIALTGANIEKLKMSLGDYSPAELSSLVGKNGELSQDGVKRVRNAMLAKAYGNSETLGRIVESTDGDMRNVLGALTKSAGVVAKARSEISAGAIPKEIDITDNLLDAVETFSQIRAKNQPLENYLAQQSMFGGSIDPDSGEILQFLHDNVRSQKKLTEFIKQVYDQITRIDQTTDNIFGDNSVPSKSEIIRNAKQRTEGQPAGQQQGIFAAKSSEKTGGSDGQESKTQTDNAGSGKESQQDSGLKKGKAGDQFAAGDVVLTASGRETTPFPKIDTVTNGKTINTLKRVDAWLIDNAIKEAESRGDEFNLLQFRNVSLKNLTQSDKDSAEIYLFEEQPEVIKSIFKNKSKNKNDIKFSRTPEERLKDRERARQLEKKLNGEGYGFSVKARDVRLGATQNGRGQEAATAERIAKIFGRRVVWIEANGDFRINGVVVPNIKDTIFIDYRTEKYAHAVIGHELSHHMEHDVPAAYRDMVRALLPMIKDIDAYRSKNALGEDMSDANVIREIVGDIMGDNFTDPVFWDKVAAANPNAFRRIADTVISWLKNLALKAKTRGLGSERWVTDVVKAQDIIAKAVAQYTNAELSFDGLKNKAMFQKAWHGSPHDHNKFDNSKIGTGEGAASYGYGHYFTDSKEVAEFYKKQLATDNHDIHKKTAINNGINETLADALANSYSYVSKDYNDFVSSIKRSEKSSNIDRLNKLFYPSMNSGLAEYVWNQFKNAGKVYQVELAPEQEDYLLWDKPLSEQSEKVQAALSEAGFSFDAEKAKILNGKLSALNRLIDSGGQSADSAIKDKQKLLDELDEFDPNIEGRDIYRNISSSKKGDKSASDYLHSLGIRGIKYLDRLSRSQGDGSYNYVIFDDNDIEIVAKFSRASQGSLFGNNDNLASQEELLKQNSARPGDLFSSSKPDDAQTQTEINQPSMIDQDQEELISDPILSVSKPSGKIDDFGEKLGGSRKDMEAALRKEYTDADIASVPLSKIWPKEEALSLEDPFMAAFAYSAREEIPTKPKLSYKVKSWVEKVKLFRGLTRLNVSGAITKDKILDFSKKYPGLENFFSKVQLLELIENRRDWSRIDSVAIYPDAYKYDASGIKIDSPYSSFKIDGRTTISNVTDIKELAESVKGALSNDAPEKLMQFEIRGRVGDYFINKKGDKEYRALKRFTDLKEARAYWTDNYDDLVAAWESVKESDNVKKSDIRGEENRPRTGQDWRKGKDVTPEQFQDAFGFRGIEFGNWVSQGTGNRDRQGMLNQAYDAIMDLSSIMGVPPKAMSLEGSLGLGFGSRGKGAALAHFEPGNLVINLTKTKGAGNLAHEWFHALDNYFQRKRGEGKSQFITYYPERMMVHKEGKWPGKYTKATLNKRFEMTGNKNYNPDMWMLDPAHPLGVRPEIEAKFSELVHVLDDSPMKQRAEIIDKGKADGYWSRIIERAARSFENYVIAKMMKAGYNNDYLANVTNVTDFSRDPARYPYLLESEIAPVEEAFDNLFAEVKTKETEKGIAMFSRASTNNDKEYLEAVKNGDMEKAQEMVNKAAKDKGYISGTDYRMMHQAPNREDYNLGTIKESGIVPDDYWTHPHYYQSDATERESFNKINSAIERQKITGRPASIMVYRAVPKTVKDDLFRNGDWVTPSREYAKGEGESIPEGYRIIMNRVSLKNLWWDANSINEIGYDDGKEYAYSNTKNNRKLIDPVTYDDEGNVIPLSKRFNKRSDNIKFSLAAKEMPETININGIDRPTTNSEGNPIHSTGAGIRAFYEWFGDSKLVDDRGRPKVYSHSTKEDFNKFKKEYGGIYLTTGESTADEIFNRYGEGFTHEVYIKSENPFSAVWKKMSEGDKKILKNIMSDLFDENDIAELRELDSSNSGRESDTDHFEVFTDGEFYLTLGRDSQDAVLNQLEKLGYDSVEFPDSLAWGESNVSTVIFEPSKIKSADNNGQFSSDNDDIKFSAKPSNANLDVNQPQDQNKETLIPETRFRKAQRLAQDSFNRFTVIKEWLADRDIGLSEQADVYGAEERYHAKVANQLEDFREQVRNPLIERISKAGFTMADVADYLEAQHAAEANEVIQKLKKDPDATAYGITEKEAGDYLAKAPKELGVLANELRSITEETKKLRLDNGLINKDITDAWEATYKHYIPVKGDAESARGTGKGMKVNFKTKRRLGHGRRDEAVIENILMDHERAIMEVEKNRVGKHLVMMSAEIAMPELITIGQPEKRKVLVTSTAYEVQVKGVTRAVFDSIEGARAFRQSLSLLDKNIALSSIVINPTSDQRIAASASPMLAENEVNVYMDGHAIRVQINDELLARAYTKMGVNGVSAIVAAGRMLNGYLSKVYTGYNPEFIMTNMVRDFTTGIINLSGEQGAKMAAKAVSNYPSSFASLLKYAYTNGKSSNNWIDSYRANGGNTGAAYLSDMERLGNEVNSEYAAYQGVISNLKQGDMSNAARAAARKVYNATLRWIYNLNQAGENAMRLSAFKAMIDSGRSVNEAAKVAKNITVNFNRKGELGAEANAAYLFFNASVQGVAATTHALIKGKYKYQAWALVSGMTTLAYLSAAALGGGDEDEYDKIDDFTRERNALIKHGDGWLKIPLPYGYGFFWNLGRTLADAQRKDELGTMPWHVAASAIEELTPLGDIVVGSDGEFKTDQVLLGLLPTAAKIPFQPGVNKQIFSGTELIPNSPFDQSQPDREKMWRGTKGTMYDQMAGWLEAGIGADVSPETLKYYTRTFTGGAGSLVDSTISAAMLKSEGAELEARETPFVRKVYSEVTIRETRAAYYKAKEEARKAAEEFRRAQRNNDLVSMQAVVKDKKEMLALDAYANKLSDVIRLSRDQQDAVRLSDKFSVAEKRLKLKEMEKQESAFYDQFLDVFNTQKLIMKKKQD